LHRPGNNFLHTLAQRINFSTRCLRGVNGVVQEHGDFSRVEHPIARLEKLIRAHHADRYDRRAEFLRDIENPLLEFWDVTIACAAGFRESQKANAGVKRRLAAPGHEFKSREGGIVRHGNIAEAPHHPAVHRNLEMRFEFESAQELGNGRIQHEGVKNIHVIRDEDARFPRIKAGRTLHFKFHASQTENIAEKEALRPVVLSRVNENREKSEESADHCKMKSADSPENHRASGEVDLPHPATSSAAGSISSERHSRQRISPSTSTFTGATRSKSIRLAPARDARGCSICVPVKRVGKFHSKRSRPIGPQRTYSIQPSVGSALGAIIIFPPVNLLLLKLRNNARRRSHSGAPSRRCGNARCSRRASRVNTPRMYPTSPQPLKRRFTSSPTSAGKPKLSRFKK